MGRLSLLLTLVFALTLTATAAANAAPGDTLYIQSDNVNVYEAPSVDAPVLMQLHQGQKLKEFRREGSWVKVIIYGEVGKDGWIQISNARPEVPNGNSTAPAVSEVEEIPTPSPTPDRRSDSDTGLPYVLIIKFTKFFGKPVKADCVITRKKGDKDHWTRSIFVPKAYSFYAKAISCWIRNGDKQNRLLVQIRQRGKVISSRSTRQFFGHIQVRSKGPWGKAYSLKCNRTRRVCKKRTRIQPSDLF